MSKFRFLAAAALFAAAAGAPAQPGPAWGDDERDGDVTRQQAIERADRHFARLDLDQDGRATAEEARQAFGQRRDERSGRAFERFDLDHDGGISRAEFEQGRERRGELRAERARRPGRRGHRHGGPGMRGERMFGEAGFVTREQMRERALARFDRLDLDRDGRLTAAERRQAREQFRHNRQERRGRTG
jgi:Ca2+-binding EF-hand superfamily protein